MQNHIEIAKAMAVGKIASQKVKNGMCGGVEAAVSGRPLQGSRKSKGKDPSKKAMSERILRLFKRKDVFNRKKYTKTFLCKYKRKELKMKLPLSIS